MVFWDPGPGLKNSIACMVPAAVGQAGGDVVALTAHSPPAGLRDGVRAFVGHGVSRVWLQFTQALGCLRYPPDSERTRDVIRCHVMGTAV